MSKQTAASVTLVENIKKLQKNSYANLVESSVYSLAKRRNWSVCSGRVDTALTQLTRS